MLSRILFNFNLILGPKNIIKIMCIRNRKETAAIETNRSAPIVTVGKVEIAAYMEIIWDVAAGIDR
jgi:hypothetical protein